MAIHPNYRPAVQNLQRYLRRLSYDDCSIPPIPVDGIFGSETGRALTVFQQREGLNPTGIADLETWTALYAAYLALIAKTEILPEYSLFTYTPIHMNEVSRNVTLLQGILNQLAFIYDFPVLPQITGIYDEATADNIRHIQNRAALEPTGIPNISTWNTILRNYSQYTAEN